MNFFSLCFFFFPFKNASPQIQETKKVNEQQKEQEAEERDKVKS